MSKTPSPSVPNPLPHYCDGLITVSKAGGTTTYTAPLWLLDMAGLASRSPIGPIDLAVPVSFTARNETDHRHADDGLAYVRGVMSQPIPDALPARTLAALASLASGPKILWTRDEWYALPHPKSGLCLKYLPGTGGPPAAAASWGIAVLTDLGHRTLARHLPRALSSVPAVPHQHQPSDAGSPSTTADPLLPTVTDPDGDRYTFPRSGRRLIMVHPSGREERIASYRDAVWKLGEMSDGATPSGPPRFVRAWTDAVRHVFPTHTVGVLTNPADTVDPVGCSKCGDTVAKVMTINDRDTCRDLAVPLGAEVCTGCSPA